MAAVTQSSSPIWRGWRGLGLWACTVCLCIGDLRGGEERDDSTGGIKLLRWWVIMVLMDQYCLPEECFSNRWLPGWARSVAILLVFFIHYVSWSSLMESSWRPLTLSAVASARYSLFLWAAGSRNPAKLLHRCWMCKIKPGLRMITYNLLSSFLLSPTVHQHTDLNITYRLTWHLLLIVICFSIMY